MMNIITEINLPPEVAGSGRTQHFRNGEFVSPQITKLQIAQYESDGGYYVLYFDKDGNELNDLFFDTLELVYRHIKWEFGVSVGETER